MYRYVWAINIGAINGGTNQVSFWSPVELVVLLKSNDRMGFSWVFSWGKFKSTCQRCWLKILVFFHHMMVPKSSWWWRQMIDNCLLRFLCSILLFNILCYSMILPGIEDEQIMCLLKDVGLDELLARTGGLDCPLQWNWWVRFFFLMEGLPLIETTMLPYRDFLCSAVVCWAHSGLFG